VKFLKAGRLDDSDEREPTEDGVGERYSAFKRLMIGSHKP